MTTLEDLSYKRGHFVNRNAEAGGDALAGIPVTAGGIVATDPVIAYNNSTADWEQVPSNTLWQVDADAVNFVRIGNSAATGTNSIALSSGATATGNYSVAAGETSEASGLHSIAVGRASKAAAAYSTAVGWQAEANGVNTIAIGQGATVNPATLWGIALGSGARVGIAGSVVNNCQYSQLVGFNNYTEAANASVLGENCAVTGQYGVAIGSRVAVSAANAVAIGGGTTGDGAQATTTNSVAIGKASTAGTGDHAMAIGSYSSATGLHSIAIGSGDGPGTSSQAGCDYGTVVGHRGVTGTLEQATAVGAFANALGRYSCAIGPSAYVGANATSSVALGKNVKTLNAQTTTMAGAHRVMLKIIVSTTAVLNTQTLYTLPADGTSINGYIIISAHNKTVTTDYAHFKIADVCASLIGGTAVGSVGTPTLLASAGTGAAFTATVTFVVDSVLVNVQSNVANEVNWRITGVFSAVDHTQ